jgi:hypothetical protein
MISIIIVIDNYGSCNIDLGMKDGFIQNDQITASSKNYQAGNSRPYNIGWCADNVDNTPYILVRIK